MSKKTRTEESKKRAKFLFVLIILTAILSITATYAWFSVQRDVEIYGFKVNVEVAENMQISLDGETWTNSIELKDMKQLYGTYTTDGGDSVYQAKKLSHLNYIPTELLPVSSVGNLSAAGKLEFVTGEVKGRKLEKITHCSETDITVGATADAKEENNKNHPYLVFDMYLRNVSRSASDTLQLNKGSIVTAESANTGLESSVRVAFVAYDDAAELSATGDAIRALGTGATKTGKVAIWEPNYNQHTDYVKANDPRITDSTLEYTTKPIDDTKITGSAQSITDVTADTDSSLGTAYVNRATEASADVQAAEGVEAVKKGEVTAVLSLKTVTNDGANELKIAGNKISKVRVYLYLEGQDPDCVDLASTGDKVNATIKLTRPAASGSIDNSYAGGES